MNITQREIPTAVSEPDFCSWLQTAAPGNAIEYHRGFLILDAAQPCRGKLALQRQQELIQLRHLAYWAAEQELVLLVQRRLAPDTFSYLAVRRVRRDRCGNAPAHLALAIAT
ncbi:hypothetical protein [Mesorhizobium kowhaii]|uniref:Uncharacterized protein n=1 Tax=Mesorhizobium kowhaii TaxID=1300272 RepID=A0A2W7E751_9HYPH|nr:hypothetical protein [Mesorhizobium kowhaii]PZV39026.1 hypothetical protein B5V02_03065 [Mesorhizobium kowhaii]